MKNAPLKGADEIENIRWNGVLVLFWLGFLSDGYILQGILYCFLYELLDLSEIIGAFDLVDEGYLYRVLPVAFRLFSKIVPDLSVYFIIQIKSHAHALFIHWGTPALLYTHSLWHWHGYPL